MKFFVCSLKGQVTSHECFACHIDKKREVSRPLCKAKNVKSPKCFGDYKPEACLRCPPVHRNVCKTITQTQEVIMSEVKKPAIAKKPTVKKDSVWKFVNTMIIEQKLTDEKIVEKAVTVFPEKKDSLKTVNVSFCRSKLNAGKMGIDGKMYSGKKLIRILPPETAKPVAKKPVAKKVPAMKTEA